MLNRSEFLQRRKEGIGGSDVASIAGISPWGTPYDVYRSKVEDVSDDEEEKEHLHWGNVLEDVIAKEFAHRSGLKVQRRNTMFRHPEHPELIANIDRYITGERAVLECKTSSEFMKDEWGPDGSDHVPLQYLAQVQHYLHVTGYRLAYLAVLIGGNKFHWYRIEYNERLALALQEKSLAFWNENVLKRIPPPPVSEEDLKIMYSKGDLDAITAVPDIITLHSQLIAAQKGVKDAMDNVKEIKTEIKAFMGDHSALLHPDGQILATWKNVKSNRLDGTALKKLNPALHSEFCKTSESRTFLVKTPKEK